MTDTLYAVQCEHRQEKVIPVRLTKTLAISMVPPFYCFHLANGKVKGMYTIKLDFDDARTSKEVREAHALNRERVYTKNKQSRDKRREETSARYRNNEWTREKVLASEKVVQAARQDVETGNATSRLSEAVEALKVLERRGPVPPDCGHPSCQMGLECEEEV